MILRVYTAPTAEPVSSMEAKLHLRVDESADDTLIAALITAAREEVERQSYHALMTQTLELTVENWWAHEIALPRPPLVSVSSITYKDDTGASATWASSNYVVGANMMPGMIRMSATGAFPSVTLYAVEPIVIRYVAGYASAALVPQSLKQAMLLLIGHWYESREQVTVGAVARDIPFGVEALCRSYRHRARTG